jgi:hypothetical protein
MTKCNFCNKHGRLKFIADNEEIVHYCANCVPYNFREFCNITKEARDYIYNNRKSIWK